MNNMTPQEEKWFLNLSTDLKIQLLEQSLEQDRFAYFMQLSKILLDAPLSDGGLSTELIESIRKQYVK